MERILFVIGSLECGGAEKQLVSLVTDIASRSDQLGYACDIFTLQRGGALLKDLMVLPVTLYNGGLEKGDLKNAPWKLLFAQLRLLRVVRQIRPTIVHAFLPLITFMGAFAARLNRVPLVITSRRALGTHQERFPVLRLFDLAGNSLSDLITVNSRAVLADTLARDHVDASKLVLIYNGIDPIPFQRAWASREMMRKALGVRPNEKLVIVVGNFIPYKGHFDLIKAARLVNCEIPTVKFLLVGEDRGIQGAIRDMAESIGVSNNVLFAGQRFDVPRLLAASDLSVLPSHEEGFSNVILESMAAGLPVVATRVGGNPEAVVDGVTGWLVPPRDPVGLAAKIVDLLRDPKKAGAWGERGRERVVKHFSIDRMVKDHLKLYSRVAGKKE